MVFEIYPLYIAGIIILILFILFLPRILRMRMISSEVKVAEELRNMVRE